MKVTKMDRATIRKINAEMEEAVQAVAKKYGVNVALGNTRFNASEMTTKVSFKIVDTDGASKADKDAVELFVGPGSFGREFQMMGRTFRLDGYNRKGKRTPVLGTEIASGRRYRFPLESVRDALEHAAELKAS